jgi:hypothetical protein
VLEELFPGFTEAMVARGGLLGDLLRDAAFEANRQRFAAGVAGLPALMPLTGVNSASDLLLAPAHRRPTHVCLDLRGLTDPARVVALPDPRSTDAPAPGTEPAGWQVTRDDDLLTLSSTGEANTGDTAVLGALAALLAAAWSRPGAGEPIRVGAADAAAGNALDRLDFSRAAAQATAG